MAAANTLLSTSYRILPMGAPSVQQDGTVSAIGASTVPGTTNVFINSQGPFFNPQMQVPGVGPTTLDFGTGLRGSDFGALLLLHELGHETSSASGFKSDAGNSNLNRRQTQKVLDKCFH